MLGEKKIYILSTRLRAIIFLAAVPLAAAGGIAVFPLYYFLTKPIPSTCLLNTVLGINCPLCGGTRCVKALMALDIEKAFYYNPFVLICAALFIIMYFYVMFRCLRKQYKPCVAITDGRLYILGAAFIGFLILRNLPFYRAVFF